MIVSIAATSIVYAAYMRTFNSRFRLEHALPSRVITKTTEELQSEHATKLNEYDKIIAKQEQAKQKKE